jgi:four helix bundle protein
MIFDHEKLDVYKLSLEFVAFAFKLCQKLSGAHRHARDQLLRASQSIPQNIAEGNGKRTVNDRRKYFDNARGSALECASILDILLICSAITDEDEICGKQYLFRIVSMLVKMTDDNSKSL